MKYPEHTKLRAVAAKTQAAGEFLDWLRTVKGLHLATENDRPHYTPLQELLADWAGIDLSEIEREKLAMLGELRAANDDSPCEA